MSDPSQGWIRLHRKIRDNPLWPKNRRFTPLEAWLDVLISANHTPAKILLGISTLVLVERGQFITSQVKLAEKWRWNRKTVSGFLSILKKDEMLDFDTSRGADIGFTRITIRNYSKYQDKEDDTLDIEIGSKGTFDGQSNGHLLVNNNNEEEGLKKEEGHELHRSSPPPTPLQPGKNGNGKDWGKRNWIPFFLHNQDYVPLPIEHFLTPQWWHNLFEQYPRQIGPGTLERVFAFMGRHFIEQPAKRPKSKKGYLQKTANLIRIQLERDERANGDRTDLSWLDPQSEFMKKHFAERSSSEGS